jgi:hypothetical protein
MISVKVRRSVQIHLTIGLENLPSHFPSLATFTLQVFQDNKLLARKPQPRTRRRVFVVDSPRSLLVKYESRI